jgi:aminoglycoside phosphotransferase family enzyme
VYQKLVPLCKDGKGNLNLINDGSIIDWLVKMRKLTKSSMLDYEIKNKTIRQEDVVRAIKLLVNFYQQTTPEKITTATYLQGLRSQIFLNKKIMGNKTYGLPQKKINNLCSLQYDFLKNNNNLFENRIKAGYVKEGHGDLRPEHICLEDPISIIDCLEFSKNLRIIDTADEISFLAMECEKIDAPEISKIILSAYTEISGDTPPPSLIHFYQSLRAAIRARMAISHLDEEKFRTSDQWKQRACHYLTLAEQHQISANSFNDSLP